MKKLLERHLNNNEKKNINNIYSNDSNIYLHREDDKDKNKDVVNTVLNYEALCSSKIMDNESSCNILLQSSNQDRDSVLNNNDNANNTIISNINNINKLNRDSTSLIKRNSNLNGNIKLKNFMISGFNNNKSMLKNIAQQSNKQSDKPKNKQSNNYNTINYNDNSRNKDTIIITNPKIKTKCNSTYSIKTKKGIVRDTNDIALYDGNSEIENHFKFNLKTIYSINHYNPQRNIDINVNTNTNETDSINNYNSNSNNINKEVVNYTNLEADIMLNKIMNKNMKKIMLNNKLQEKKDNIRKISSLSGSNASYSDSNTSDIKSNKGNSKGSSKDNSRNSYINVNDNKKDDSHIKSNNTFNPLNSIVPIDSINIGNVNKNNKNKWLLNEIHNNNLNEVTEKNENEEMSILNHNSYNTNKLAISSSKLIDMKSSNNNINNNTSKIKSNDSSMTMNLNNISFLPNAYEKALKSKQRNSVFRSNRKLKNQLTIIPIKEIEETVINTNSNINIKNSNRENNAKKTKKRHYSHFIKNRTIVKNRYSVKPNLIKEITNENNDFQKRLNLLKDFYSSNNSKSYKKNTFANMKREIQQKTIELSRKSYHVNIGNYNKFDNSSLVNIENKMNSVLDNKISKFSNVSNVSNVDDLSNNCLFKNELKSKVKFFENKNKKDNKINEEDKMEKDDGYNENNANINIIDEEDDFNNIIKRKSKSSHKKARSKTRSKTKEEIIHNVNKTPDLNNNINNSNNSNSNNISILSTHNQNRKIQIFKNIEDSHSEGEDYDYFDFIPKWYSINPRSSLNKTNTLIIEYVIALSLIFYPLELVYLNPVKAMLFDNLNTLSNKESINYVHNTNSYTYTNTYKSKLIYSPIYSYNIDGDSITLIYFIHFFFEFSFIFIYICYFLTGVHDPRTNKINYNLGMIYYINSIKNSLFTRLIDLMNVLFNIIVFLILLGVLNNNIEMKNKHNNLNTSSVNGLNYDNNNLTILYIFDFLILSKFFLLFKLNNWIHMDSILSARNRLIDINNSKTFANSKGKSKKSNTELQENENDDNYLISGNMLINKISNTIIKIAIAFIKFLAAMKVLLFYFLLIHISGCIWIYLYSISEYDYYYINNNNWVKASEIFLETFSSQYLASIYFILTTILSVGYGDIRPFNTRERVFTCVIMIIGCFFYSFLVTFISNVFQTTEIKYAILAEKKRILQEISIIYNIEDDLHKRILNSINYSTRDYKNDKLSLVENLPSNLRYPMQKYIYSRIIKKLDFLKQQELNFVFFTCNLFKNQIFEEKNMRLVQFNQRIEEVFFIVEGNILLKLNEEYDNYIIARVMEKNSYGEDFDFNKDVFSKYSLVTGSRINEISSLSKDNFLSVKIKFPQQVEDYISRCAFRNSLIEEIRLGAIAYYTIHGTLNGYRDFSMKQINDEIVRELCNGDNNNCGNSNVVNVNYEILKNNFFKARTMKKAGKRLGFLDKIIEDDNNKNDNNDDNQEVGNDVESKNNNDSGFVLNSNRSNNNNNNIEIYKRDSNINRNSSCKNSPVVNFLNINSNIIKNNNNSKNDNNENVSHSEKYKLTPIPLNKARSSKQLNTNFMNNIISQVQVEKTNNNNINSNAIVIRSNLKRKFISDKSHSNANTTNNLNDNNNININNKKYATIFSKLQSKSVSRFNNSNNKNIFSQITQSVNIYNANLKNKSSVSVGSKTNYNPNYKKGKKLTVFKTKNLINKNLIQSTKKTNRNNINSKVQDNLNKLLKQGNLKDLLKRKMLYNEKYNSKVQAKNIFIKEFSNEYNESSNVNSNIDGIVNSNTAYNNKFRKTSSIKDNSSNNYKSSSNFKMNKLNNIISSFTDPHKLLSSNINSNFNNNNNNNHMTNLLLNSNDSNKISELRSKVNKEFKEDKINISNSSNNSEITLQLKFKDFLILRLDKLEGLSGFYNSNNNSNYDNYNSGNLYKDNNTESEYKNLGIRDRKYNKTVISRDSSNSKLRNSLQNNLVNFKDMLKSQIKNSIKSVILNNQLRDKKVSFYNVDNLATQFKRHTSSNCISDDNEKNNNLSSNYHDIRKLSSNINVRKVSNNSNFRKYSNTSNNNNKDNSNALSLHTKQSNNNISIRKRNMTVGFSIKNQDSNNNNTNSNTSNIKNGIRFSTLINAQLQGNIKLSRKKSKPLVNTFDSVFFNDEFESSDSSPKNNRKKYIIYNNNNNTTTNKNNFNYGIRNTIYSNNTQLTQNTYNSNNIFIGWSRSYKKEDLSRWDDINYIRNKIKFYNKEDKEIDIYIKKNSSETIKNNYFNNRESGDSRDRKDKHSTTFGFVKAGSSRSVCSNSISVRSNNKNNLYGLIHTNNIKEENILGNKKSRNISNKNTLVRSDINNKNNVSFGVEVNILISQLKQLNKQDSKILNQILTYNNSSNITNTNNIPTNKTSFKLQKLTLLSNDSVIDDRFNKDIYNNNSNNNTNLITYKSKTERDIIKINYENYKKYVNHQEHNYKEENKSLTNTNNINNINNKIIFLNKKSKSSINIINQSINSNRSNLQK